MKFDGIQTITIIDKTHRASLAREYLSAAEVASTWALSLATAYRIIKTAPSSCKRLIYDPLTGRRHIVISRAGASSQRSVRRRPGNPNLTAEHQRHAGKMRWRLDSKEPI